MFSCIAVGLVCTSFCISFKDWGKLSHFFKKLLLPFFYNNNYYYCKLYNLLLKEVDCHMFGSLLLKHG